MHDGDLRGSSLFCFLLKSLARHKFRHMHVYAPEKGSLIWRVIPFKINH